MLAVVQVERGLGANDGSVVPLVTDAALVAAHERDDDLGRVGAEVDDEPHRDAWMVRMTEPPQLVGTVDGSV